jgi:lipopolysaccharide assembly outer membrane protein LptD (OstA)
VIRYVRAAAVAAAALWPLAALADLETPDYHIVTAQAHTNLETGDFSMPQKVRLTRPGTDAVADSAHGNSKRGLATLVGHVVVHDSGNAPEAAGASAYKGSGPATLLCDQLDVDARAKLYTAIGHVHFTQGASSGSADRAVLDRATGKLHLEGDVHLSQNGSTLVAQTVDYNLNTRDADMTGSPVQMTEPANQTVATPSPGPKPRPTAKPKPRPTRRP